MCDFFQQHYQSFRQRQKIPCAEALFLSLLRDAEVRELFKVKKQEFNRGQRQLINLEYFLIECIFLIEVCN
jgi:hypothetical protein